LCSNEDGVRVVKILDFGISKLLYDTNQNLTATSMTIGTPLYMSPEQIRSSKNVDARTDVWSLGVILYEILSGRPPFIGSGPAIAASIATDQPPALSRFRPEAPQQLLNVLYQAMQKDANLRFPNAAAFGEALALLPRVDEPDEPHV